MHVTEEHAIADEDAAGIAVAVVLAPLDALEVAPGQPSVCGNSAEKARTVAVVVGEQGKHVVAVGDAPQDGR